MWCTYSSGPMGQAALPRVRTARGRPVRVPRTHGRAWLYISTATVARWEASEVDGFGVEVLDEALKLLADQVRDDLLEHACARVSARQVTQQEQARSQHLLAAGERMHGKGVKIAGSTLPPLARLPKPGSLTLLDSSF